MRVLRSGRSHGIPSGIAADRGQEPGVEGGRGQALELPGLDARQGDIETYEDERFVSVSE